ncbi:hypothetical protein BV898_15065 [Hypsibius exemplaris]|uniref:TLDc domain-containing protein n=1 Tax=Hypsibius exemplaris TaxID=2072580 RepID=A0A9X6RK16_HYPEX|nr:hypothetical protein BV898_15065 [Hypsibius exemplaris]
MNKGWMKHFHEFHEKFKHRKSGEILCTEKQAKKWTQLSTSLALSSDEASRLSSTIISKQAFENQFQETAPFLGPLLFQHFQSVTKPGESHADANLMTHKAFVRNVMEVLSLNSEEEQTRFYFRVFSKGTDHIHEDEMLMMLTISVKVACSATGLSRLINDADQQVFHSLVRSLDLEDGSEVDVCQFKDWIRQNGVHLLNCMHHFVVQSLISCTGLPNEHFPESSKMDEDSLPLLDQDNEKCLQLNSMALLWLLSCALPPCYIKRGGKSAVDFSSSTFRGLPYNNSASPLPSATGSRMHLSPSLPTMNPHQFIQELVAAAHLTTWTLLYNSDKHGMSMNRFLHHTLHYSGPTISIFRLESGSAYCIAVDTEWRESTNRWGGADCVIYQIQPQFKRLECGMNLVYLNDHARGGSYRGLEIGSDPKRPILKVAPDMTSAESDGNKDTLVCVEVWGCAGSAPKVAQSQQIKWENRQAERMQKITRPQRWQDSTDRYLIDLVKNGQRYTAD